MEEKEGEQEKWERDRGKQGGEEQKKIGMIENRKTGMPREGTLKERARKYTQDNVLDSCYMI